MSVKNSASTESASDVIVVGGGGAGLMAALSAACYGRSVRLLEKRQTLGGTTGLSAGTIRTRSTTHQRRSALNRFFGMTGSFPSHTLITLGPKKPGHVTK
jgi:succinate dehydrogenase/fumarate reductase flavoprotein subunit